MQSPAVPRIARIRLSPDHAAVQPAARSICVSTPSKGLAATASPKATSVDRNPMTSSSGRRTTIEDLRSMNRRADHHHRRFLAWTLFTDNKAPSLWTMRQTQRETAWRTTTHRLGNRSVVPSLQPKPPSSLRRSSWNDCESPDWRIVSNRIANHPASPPVCPCALESIGRIIRAS